MVFLVLTWIPWGSNRGYAVLAVDASYPDRFIGDLLASEAAPDFTRNYISESTQWVFLDDFGTLQRIPLDTYRDRVEPFDPRDDGYAEKLRSFFVREGKRLFFMPIPPLASDSGAADPWLTKRRITALEASITPVLGKIPFSLTFLGHEQPRLFYFLLFVLAGGATIAFSGEPALFMALLPVLGALTFAGPPGLALGAALAVLSGTVAEPIRDRWAAHRYRLDPAGHYGKLYPVLAVPLGTALFFLGIFGILYGISPPAGNLTGAVQGKSLALLGTAGLVCSGGILWLLLWIEANQGNDQDHVRFMPVRIMEATNWGRINRTLIPFALASLAALYGPQMSEGLRTYHDPGFIADPRYLIDAAAYETHAAYQVSFSFIPLGRGPEPSLPVVNYRQYRLGEDGLIAEEFSTGAEGDPPPSLAGEYPYGEPVIPPFPLEDLIAFLEGFSHTTGGELNGVTALRIISLSMLGLVLFLMAPGVYRRGLRWYTQRAGKKKHILVYNEKRIAA
jgi:hypothetical protein